MTIDTEDLLNSILKSLDRIDYIKPEDIPNIDLYMDQVTTFMDSRLKSTVRDEKEDRILTKTMINNYAKNDLLPPPVRKKYSKEHVLLLIFIYYFKGILSIGDIQMLLGPITEKFFGQGAGMKLEDIYQEVFSLEKNAVEELKADVADKFRKSKETFQGAKEENQEFLQMFSLLCMLSFDVYVKKLLIEKLLDGQMQGKEQKGTKTKGTKEKVTREKASKEKDK